MAPFQTELRRALRGISSVFLALGSAAALAADDPAFLFTEQDYLSDIPEVISATRMSQKLTQAPAAITIIDQETIRAAGVIEVTDLFRLVPGMQAFNVAHNKFGVTYHGVSDNFPTKLEVMVDGRSIYLPLLSTVDWGSLGLALEDISHIEVVRGSNVPAYGSNAFLGAINIVTRSPLAEVEQNSIKTVQGAQGTQHYEFRHSGMGEWANYRISGGYRSNDGTDLFGDSEIDRYFNFASSFSPSLNDTVELQLGATDGHVDLVAGDKLDGPVDRRQNESNYQYLRWNRILDGRQDLQLSLYRNYLDLDTELLSAEQVIVREVDAIDDLATAHLFALSQGLDGTFLRADAEHGSTETWDTELQYTGHLDDRWSLILGGGYRYETAASDSLLASSADIGEERWRLFTNLQWLQSDQLTWNAGMMYEYSSAIHTGRVSPRLAANYLLSEGTAVRAAYTRAYRMPSLLDAHNSSRILRNDGTVWDSIQVSNDQLSPEKLDSFELGLYTRLGQWDSELDLRLFHERVRDGLTTFFFVTDDINGFSSRIDNTAQWDANGFELQYRARPWMDGLLQLSYGYVNIDGTRDRGVKDPDQAEFAGGAESIDNAAPENTLSLLLSQHFSGGWQASMAVYHMSDVRWFEGGQREGYWRTDLRLARTMPLDADWRAELALVVQDAFNESYAEFYPFNEFDRRAFVQLRLVH
ncbi:TonB-dependent receptor plug domain-containing protein [Marinobacterium arenosum]|uniref:TonB-dependent receptor plug domain-containing protein n=1 Tax=Marinobacterium arenosum TaxID=2862496 RepID=UPI001C95E25E|nr:TonB-dependent receptor [Marinobacterium arenosum]MBY4677551.1 TonB-dependent receptor [Marinobacterium arenosum]